MNIMMIGFGMILIPTAVAMALAVVLVFRMLLGDMIEAYRGRNVTALVAAVFICSFVIGVVLVMIGSV